MNFLARLAVYFISKKLIFFLSVVPICLLEVDTSTTRIVSSFQYEIYNTSFLKFAYGDEITLTCKRGYKALDPTVNMTCNPEHNGTWSRKLPSTCRGTCTCIYWALIT